MCPLVASWCHCRVNCQNGRRRGQREFSGGGAPRVKHSSGFTLLIDHLEMFGHYMNILSLAIPCLWLLVREESSHGVKENTEAAYQGYSNNCIIKSTTGYCSLLCELCVSVCVCERVMSDHCYLLYICLIVKTRMKAENHQQKHDRIICTPS
jgi:hypothetical protein